ncbi:hypothetical protein GCM10012284_54590 [Mangrovihabitans endophyticus]|uniref:Uncharacterized protein n=1 Tax=Mangrovihabitans endophyticus TaxID=1751298 RepID=A0A8J3C3F0_9ACTN|nr:hypothetical protein GCM10012284_54590 [Mangrovihabitans endophyticus]
MAGVQRGVAGVEWGVAGVQWGVAGVQWGVAGVQRGPGLASVAKPAPHAYGKRQPRATLPTGRRRLVGYR